MRCKEACLPHRTAIPRKAVSFYVTLYVTSLFFNLIVTFRDYVSRYDSQCTRCTIHATFSMASYVTFLCTW